MLCCIDKKITSLQQVKSAGANATVQVSFVSLDPDMLYVRHLHTSLPVGFAIGTILSF